MGPGAIVVVAAKDEAFAQGQGSANSAASARLEENAFLAGPLACREILGRSVVERMVERFLNAEVEFVSVLLDEKTAFRIPKFRTIFNKVKVQIVPDVHSAIAEKLNEYSKNGIEHSFVHSAEAYTENDLMDLFYFHREARQKVTRAFDHEGSLPLWVVDCAKAQQSNVENLLEDAGRDGSSYFIRERVHRLAQPRDLRQLSVDMLRGRCQKGPCGREVRPGVWIDEGAEVHRSARIVAPAYIGRQCEIEEDTLITRDSAIESGCHIGYGTVIEDSSILPNTAVGIWLDVCHAVVDGNKLFNLEHDVVLEIADPRVMHSTVPSLEVPATVSVRNERRTRTADRERDVQRNAGPQAEHASPRAWQLGANLIQE